MAKLDDEEIQRIVDAIVAELDRRRQIEQLADAIIRKQSELNKRLMQAPEKYQRKQLEPTGNASGGDGQRQSK